MMKDDLAKLYKYKYEGSKEVDASTLLQSQIHFINTLKLIQNKIYPSYDQKITYLPAVEGSHELLLNIDWQAVTGLFQDISFKEYLASAKTSIEIFADLVKLHKGLKGKKPENEVQNAGNVININLGHHNTFNVNESTLDLYKKNPKIVDEIINSFVALEADESVKGIKLHTDTAKDSLLQIPQNQFHLLTLPNPYIEGDETEKTRIQVSVFVKTPDFYPKPNRIWQWSFLYNSRPIRAKITDNQFKDLINHGLRYGQGDRLIVDLKLIYKRDAAVGAYVIRKYEIIKVHNSIFRTDESLKSLL